MLNITSFFRIEPRVKIDVSSILQYRQSLHGVLYEEINYDSQKWSDLKWRSRRKEGRIIFIDKKITLYNGSKIQIIFPINKSSNK